MVFGFLEMLLEAGLQWLVGGGLGHFGQGLDQEGFREMKIAQFFDEQFFESGDFGHDEMMVEG